MGDYAFQRVKKIEKYLSHTSATEGCIYRKINLSKMEG
jgi:hypothetical protein